LLEKGYKQRELKFNNLLYKIKFEHLNERRFIDINIFRENKLKSIFWCPQPVPYFKTNKNYSKFNWKSIIVLYFNYIKKYLNSSTLTDAPWKWGFNHFTWVIPNTFFNNFDIYKLGMKTPHNPEKYLDLRYGDWKKPSKNWDFIFDDKGLSKNNPNFYINNIKNEI